MSWISVWSGLDGLVLEVPAPVFRRLAKYARWTGARWWTPKADRALWLSLPDVRVVGRVGRV